ncbi:FAD-binding protein [Chloroflexota bacterium]
MFEIERQQCDVLCVGGGLAGLMAGIRASELGAKVIIADKGNTLRSGSGASGCDYLCCYIPEVHGTDIEPYIEEHYNGPMCVPRDKPPVRAWLERSFDTVKLWDSWGIPTKYHGEYNFGGQAIPGHPRMWLHYEGQNQKQVLTRETLKRGAQIRNRVAIIDLVRTRDAVTGAIGVSTGENRLIEFRAKSVILTTGWQTRLFPAPVPAYPFALSSPPENTGETAGLWPTGQAPS